MSERGPSRAAVLASIMVLLVAAAVVDRADRRGAAPPEKVSAGAALSTTWYCAGGTATKTGRADGLVVIANPGPDPLTGELAVMGDGQEKKRPIEVGARSRLVVRYGDDVEAGYAGAIVELRGGAGVVEQYVQGPLGHSAAPCATSASPEWHFAEGATTKDALLVLALFNPFPEDAIADLAFATEQGRAVPADFQGVVVPARSVVAVDVGSHVRRREQISGSVSTRSGRLVVEKLQLRTGAGRAGISVSPLASSPGDLWRFPEGYIVAGITEQLHLYNPSDREARADVELALETGDVEPFELTVPPQGRVTLDLGAEPRVPKGVPHATIVTVTNGVPVVAEQAITSTPPASRAGRSVTTGTSVSARRWGFAVGAATPQWDEWLAVFNPGAEEVTFSVRVLANGQSLAVEGLQEVPLAGGRRMGVRLGDHIQREDTSLVVQASGPVVVERSLFAVGSHGISTAIGVPLD